MGLGLELVGLAASGRAGFATWRVGFRALDSPGSGLQGFRLWVLEVFET